MAAKKELLVIKIGGNIIDDAKALKKFISDLSKINKHKILIHGGGKLATQFSAKMGIKTQMVDGRRITDAETLKIVTMVYAGWINKSITAAMNAKGTKALGISGADLFVVPSVKRKNAKMDFGFVGDVIENKIQAEMVNLLLSKGITPVIAPITSSLKGQLLNTNADTMASSLAVAMSRKYKVKLIYGFEKNGVLEEEKIIPSINSALYQKLKDRQIVKDGMIPKLDNAFLAIDKGVNEVVIGHAGQIKKIISSDAGTRITK